MRSCCSLLLAMVSATGCAGGQTGEITELTRCTEPTEIALGEAERADLEARGQPTTGRLTWAADGATTELVVSFTLIPGPATRLTGEECERPVLVVPVDLRLDTADGRLADVLVGTLERPEGADDAAIRASRAVRDLEGSFDPSWVGPLDDDAGLVAAISRSEGTSVGQLFVAPGGEGDEREVAAW